MPVGRVLPLPHNIVWRCRVVDLQLERPMPKVLDADKFEADAITVRSVVSPPSRVSGAVPASRSASAGRGRVRSMRPRDTTPAAHEAQLRCYRRMSGAERV